MELNLIDNCFNYIIIGAGPAGLQMGYFLQQQQSNYIILERADNPADFFRHYPRHHNLISINKIYTGYDDPEQRLRWDWNSLLSDDLSLRVPGNYSKRYFPTTDEYIDYLLDFAQRKNLNICTNTNVTRIRKRDGEFLLELEDSALLHTKHLLIATGVSQPYIPNIPGIETVEQYIDVPVDPENFVDQRVLVIGKGNSGFEFAGRLLMATRLIHMASPTPVTFAWRSHFPGHVRALNMELLDTYQLKSQNALINAEITSIEHKDNEYHVHFAYNRANGEEETLVYDRVVCCAGFRYDNSIFDANCSPELTKCGRLPMMTSCFESTNVSDCYFIGTLMQMRDYKKKQSAFIHGFRYNIEFLAKYLNQKYYNEPIPAQTLPMDKKALTTAIIENVNRSSALWQQTGFLCDVFVCHDDRDQIACYQTVPTDFVRETDFAGGRDVFILTLEFGQEIFDKCMNTFAVERVHKDDYENAQMSPGLHPIVRHYRGNQLISAHHVIEDFANEWAEEVHVKPLEDYLARELTQLQSTAEVASA